MWCTRSQHLCPVSRQPQSGAGLQSPPPPSSPTRLHGALPAARRFYAPQLFESIGHGTNAALLNTVVIGAVNVASTVVAILCVDKFGRKVLFLGGRSPASCRLQAPGRQRHALHSRCMLDCMLRQQAAAVGSPS
jgi:hypothetical protein